MAKQGMERQEDGNNHAKNIHGPVPILQGKIKSGKEKARSIVAGTEDPQQKVWHHSPDAQFDNDLAMENLLNDVPEIDR